MLTLGINYSQRHDSAACIVRDGELLFAVAEERISRVTHDGQFPQLAIKACLDFAGIRAKQLDKVCFGWQTAGPAYRHDLKLYALGDWPITYGNLLNSTGHFLSMWHQQSGAKRFAQRFGPIAGRTRFVDHHLAHAISAYAYSGFDEATIVVMDGRGAWEATSIWWGRKGRIEHGLTIPFPDSIGVFYSGMTEYLGFVPNSDEWKVESLAAFGRPSVKLDAFINTDASPYHVHAKRLSRNGSGLSSSLVDALGPARAAKDEIEERHKNIAYATQECCEQAMLSVVRMAIEKTRCRNLCLAGGVALNSRANAKILASGLVDKIFVQPAASDDGVALGAALAPYLDHGGRLPNRAMPHSYWGPGFDDDVAETALRTYRLRYKPLSDPAAAAAELIYGGNIVGWFQGRMEFGPRALGSRSILADPRDPEMGAKVSTAMKSPEWWPPLPCSLKKEAAQEYLGGTTDSPFMTIAAQVRPEKRRIIPSVTHVDANAGVQTVEKEVSPLYWRLIEEFRKRSGVPVVMNMPFQIHSEPIVHTPTDAVRTFFSSGMDALVIGSFLLEK